MKPAKMPLKRKPKIKAAGTTLVTFLLDKSGSMSSIRSSTIEAFNAYLSTLKAAGDGILFSFLQFDSVAVEKVCANAPISTVRLLDSHSYQPRAGTPLVDAAYKTIKAVEAALEHRDDKPKVVVCIQTDGEENSSREYSWHDLSALITAKTVAGWQFNFMGAGIDAYQQGQRMGIVRESTVSYDADDAVKTRSVFLAQASNTASFASGALRNTNYSMGQKGLAGDKFDPSLAKRAASSLGSAEKPVGDITL